jgi:hypothetical protein
MAYELISPINSAAGQSNGQYFVIGRVKKIVMGPFVGNTKIPDPDYNHPGDVGKIKYELLYSPLATSKALAVSEPAYPIFSFIKQLPVVNEIVLILGGPTEKLNDSTKNQQFFYFPPYSLWNHVNHGAFPNMSEYADYLNKFSNQPGYSGTATQGPKLPLGPTFQEQIVRNLRPFEGDSILESRYGQSIRFGSTVPVMKNFNTWSNSGKNGDPITIIINKQGSRPGLGKFDNMVEDINKDGSSIYMTSTQEINIEDLNYFPLASFGTNITPQSQNILQIQTPPLSDESISAQFQDENSIK